MRWRGVAVLTNTPPRSQQRSPGPMQANAIMEPVVTKAANKLGLDQVAIRRINSPEGKALYGPSRPNGQRGHITSAFVKEALDRGAELFNWDERKARAGKRQGSKVRGVGVAVGPHGSGSIGYDGLMTIRPDGKLYVQSGVGNLGTHSCIDLARVAADVLAMPWDKVVVNWGSTAKNIPWSAMSVGSQTTHAMTRANLAGAEDARLKLQEIAAKDLGGAPADYVLSATSACYRRDNPSRGLTYAQAATRAIALGGKFDGHELPADIHRDDEEVGGGARRARADGRGQGQLSARRRHLLVRGRLRGSRSRSSRPARRGSWTTWRSATSAPSINPRSLHGQLLGGINLGIGHALQQKWVYDPHYGVPLAKRFYHNKPLTILDIPAEMHDATRSTSPIRKRRSARAASASRRSAPATAR